MTETIHDTEGHGYLATFIGKNGRWVAVMHTHTGLVAVCTHTLAWSRCAHTHTHTGLAWWVAVCTHTLAWSRCAHTHWPGLAW